MTLESNEIDSINCVQSALPVAIHVDMEGRVHVREGFADAQCKVDTTQLLLSLLLLPLLLLSLVLLPLLLLLLLLLLVLLLLLILPLLVWAVGDYYYYYNYYYY